MSDCERLRRSSWDLWSTGWFSFHGRAGGRGLHHSRSHAIQGFAWMSGLNFQLERAQANKLTPSGSTYPSRANLHRPRSPHSGCKPTLPYPITSCPHGCIIWRLVLLIHSRCGIARSFFNISKKSIYIICTYICRTRNKNI